MKVVIRSLQKTPVIDQMKVVGLRRKGNYAERWQELITQATPVFNKLCEIAGKCTRHIILDQTNVFPRARSKKVQEYRRFGTRRAVIILNDEDTLQQRTEKREREEGKFVPVEAVMGMKQNFTKPNLSEGFTHVDYVEAPESDAGYLIRQYNDAGWDFKRRNPGMGKGGKPQPPLHTRDISNLTFDRNNFRERQDLPEGKGQYQDYESWRADRRSRSPRRRGSTGHDAHSSRDARDSRCDAYSSRENRRYDDRSRIESSRDNRTNEENHGYTPSSRDSCGHDDSRYRGYETDSYDTRARMAYPGSSRRRDDSTYDRDDGAVRKVFYSGNKMRT